MDNDEMAELLTNCLEHLEIEFGYEFNAAVSVEDGDYSNQCKVTIFMNRQEGYND